MTAAPRRAVLDANVAIKWVVTEPDSARALRLREGQMHAPDLIVAECANILWKKVAGGNMTAATAIAAAELLRIAPIGMLPTADMVRRAVDLAVTLDHPAYDCFYLLCAADLDVPLVTADLRLVRAVDGKKGTNDMPEIVLLSDVT